jgi:hypothetical protein
MPIGDMADDFPTKSLERRMRCTRCEREGADVRSDYSQHGWRGNFIGYESA